MVILLKQHAPQAEQERVLAWLRELGAEVRVTGTAGAAVFLPDGRHFPASTRALRRASRLWRSVSG